MCQLKNINTGKSACDFDINLFQGDTNRSQYPATRTRTRTRSKSQPLYQMLINVIFAYRIFRIEQLSLENLGKKTNNVDLPFACLNLGIV